EREEWNSLNEERDQNVRLIDELEARAERLRELADEPAAIERGDSFQTAPARGVRGNDIYDLTTVRRDSTDSMVRDLRDRAMRSVEGAKFPEQVEREH